MNPNEERVIDALRALAAHDRERQSATSADALFDRRPRRTPRMAWLAVPVAAAAALVLLLSRPADSPARPPVIKSEPITRTAPAASTMSAAPAPMPRPRPIRRVLPATPREVVTAFFPLMDSPPPMQRGEVVRVTVPASTMATVGLPVRPERWADGIQADVLVGEEGLARAIRFVSYER